MFATGPQDPPEIRVLGAGGALAATPAPRSQAGKAGAEQQQRAGLGNRGRLSLLDRSPFLVAVVVVVVLAEERVEVEVRGSARVGWEQASREVHEHVPGAASAVQVVVEEH